MGNGLEFGYFNTQLKAFLKALIQVFPNDRDIKKISSALNIAMMDDPDEAIMKHFYTMMLPHKSLIVVKNPLFFTQDSDNFFRGTVADKNNIHQYTLFTKLHGYWDELTDSNKQVVWEYIDVLFSYAATNASG